MLPFLTKDIDALPKSKKYSCFTKREFRESTLIESKKRYYFLPESKSFLALFALVIHFSGVQGSMLA